MGSRRTQTDDEDAKTSAFCPLWPQTESNFGLKMGKSGHRPDETSVCSHVLGRSVCPFYPKRTHADRMGRAVELASAARRREEAGRRRRHSGSEAYPTPAFIHSLLRPRCRIAHRHGQKVVPSGRYSHHHSPPRLNKKRQALLLVPDCPRAARIPTPPHATRRAPPPRTRKKK